MYKKRTQKFVCIFKLVKIFTHLRYDTQIQTSYTILSALVFAIDTILGYYTEGLTSKLEAKIQASR